MNKIIYIACVATLLLVACSKEPEVAKQQEDGDTCILQFSTRSGDEGDNFETGETFRMAVYDVEKNKTYLESTLEDTYNDVLAKKTNSGWRFSFDGDGDNGSLQFGFMREEDKKIRIVAVAPYVSDLNLENLYYTPSVTKSYMCAVEDNIDISGTTFDATLNFTPITAALTFKITLKNSTTSVTFDGVNLSVIDKNSVAQEERIPSAGRVNARTKELIVKSYSAGSSVPIAIGGDFGIKYITNDDGTIEDSYYYIEKTVYIYPVEFGKDDANEKLRISFTIDKATLDTTIDLKASAFGENGMEVGYNYSLNIELDNYLRFDGTITKEEWTPADDKIQTEI